MDEIEREARRRTESHRGHKSQRILGKNHDLVGLRGEQEFGRLFRMQPDLTAKPRGDGHIDFWLGPYEVDTKCARRGDEYMLVEARYCFPLTIYVGLQYFDATDSAEVIGWQWGKVIMKKYGPPYDTGCGIINYKVPAGVDGGLRGISDLFGRAQTG